MTKAVSSLDQMEFKCIQNDVDKLKSVISQIVSYARNDDSYKDERKDLFEELLEDMFIQFVDKFEDVREDN